MIRVTILKTAGSVPRETGTEMRVTAEGIRGTIGGGALEWRAMKVAREMLESGTERAERTLPLGPSLGQCCGGSVTLLFEAIDPETPFEETGAPLWIWGAGHVGRALVGVLGPLPDYALTWVDTAENRFPEADDGMARRLVAAQPDVLVRHAPTDAHHLILTYSHDIDLALCHALLSHDFASTGLIGSATKWARFRKRLVSLGHTDAQTWRIACPIGDPTLGKHPQAIAVGVATGLLRGAERQGARAG